MPLLEKTNNRTRLLVAAATPLPLGTTMKSLTGYAICAEFVNHGSARCVYPEATKGWHPTFFMCFDLLYERHVVRLVLDLPATGDILSTH